jgi:hypothetical protein
MGDTGERDVKGGLVPARLCCVECGVISDAAALRWRSYRIDDPSEDEEPALAFYCPSCAEREFGRIGPDREQSNLEY